MLTESQLYQKQVFLGKRVTLSAESTFANILYEKKVDPFNACANSAHACSDCLNNTRTCSDCLILTKLTRLGEPKCLYGEKLTQLEG